MFADLVSGAVWFVIVISLRLRGLQVRKYLTSHLPYFHDFNYTHTRYRIRNLRFIYGFDDEIPFHAGTLHVVPAASAGDRPGRRGGGRRGAVHHQVVGQHGGNQGEKYLDGISTD